MMPMTSPFDPRYQVFSRGQQGGPHLTGTDSPAQSFCAPGAAAHSAAKDPEFTPSFSPMDTAAALNIASVYSYEPSGTAKSLSPASSPQTPHLEVYANSRYGPHSNGHSSSQWADDGRGVQGRSPPEARSLGMMGEEILAAETRRCHFISSVFELESVCNLLMRESVIAINYREFAEQSYQFVCLLQVSASSEDFLIDTAQLRHQLASLNRVLCNANVLKVLFDQNLTLPFLYNLLGLDITNYADVAKDHTSRTPHELAQKVFPIMPRGFPMEPSPAMDAADWRFRPLPAEMSLYAQQETCLLLSMFYHLQMTRGGFLCDAAPSNPMAERSHQRHSSWNRPADASWATESSGSAPRLRQPGTGHTRKKSGQYRSQKTASGKTHHRRTSSRCPDDLFTSASWSAAPDANLGQEGASPTRISSAPSLPATGNSNNRHGEATGRLSADCSVPESMEEIYQLSNANRKRNKAKKKRGKGADSPSDEEEDDEDDSPCLLDQGAAAEPREKPQDFMRKIGWLSVSSKSHRRTRSGDGPEKPKGPKRRGKKNRKQANGTYPPRDFDESQKRPPSGETSSHR